MTQTGACMYLVFKSNTSMLWLTFRFNDSDAYLSCSFTGGTGGNCPQLGAQSDTFTCIQHGMLPPSELSTCLPGRYIAPFQKHQRFQRGVIYVCAHICVCLKFNMSSKDTSLYVLPANVTPQISHPEYMLMWVTGEIKDFEELLIFIKSLMLKQHVCMRMKPANISSSQRSGKCCEAL